MLYKVVISYRESELLALGRMNTSLLLKRTTYCHTSSMGVALGGT